MSPERWRQVRILFESAIALDLQERSSLLDDRCAFDEALRGEVEALLAAYERSETFLEEPALGLAVGSRVGPYRLERQIGSGGMGAVYLASRMDGSYERRVAIKMVHANLRSPELLERFRTERQLLALLDHPNISRLLDGGETRTGVPYLVMEFIDGLPIDEYSKRHNLPIRDRLRLVRQVCGAVSFAHRNLIIHRDIKPGNVLVDGEGSAKLLDFGVARLMDFAPEQTRSATISRVFTPEYASPEQLSGKPVTTASDEYSLGVLLQKLMEGGVVPEDLQSVMGKAMREEPDARYSSVEAFSADLERFLNQQPVLARMGQLRYRAWKFVQRRKTLVSSAATILVVASLGGIVAVRQQRHAEQERALAETRTAEVQRLAGSFLAELHDSGRDPIAARAMRARLLPGMLAQLDRLAAAPGRNDALSRALALGYANAGDLQQELGDFIHAVNTYRKTLLEGRRIGHRDPALMNLLASVEETLSHLTAGETAATGESIQIPRARIASASLMGPLGGPIGSLESVRGYGYVGCSGVRTSDQKTVPHGTVVLERIGQNELRVRVTLLTGDPSVMYGIGLFSAAPSCSLIEETGTGDKFTTDSAGNGERELFLHLPFMKHGFRPVTGGPNESAILVLYGIGRERFSADPIPVPEWSTSSASAPDIGIRGVNFASQIEANATVDWADLPRVGAFNALPNGLRIFAHGTKVAATLSAENASLDHRMQGAGWDGSFAPRAHIITNSAHRAGTIQSYSGTIEIQFGTPIISAGAHIQWGLAQFVNFRGCIEAFDSQRRLMARYCRTNLLSTNLADNTAPFIGLRATQASIRSVRFYVRGDQPGFPYGDGFAIGNVLVRITP